MRMNFLPPVAALLSACLAPPFCTALRPYDRTTTISLEQSVVSQHEPVLLKIEVNNSSSTTIDFDPGYDKEQVEVSVTDPAGKVWKAQRPAVREGMRFSNAVKIPPGASVVTRILLNDDFKFEMIGEYRIAVALSSSIVGPSPRKLNAERVKLTLRVESRDPLRLELACEGLLRRINNLDSASDAIVAAEALSKVDDPASIPYLKAAMERREFVAMMIGALARLRTEDALRVLDVASHSDDAETRSLARSALAGLGTEPK